MAERIQNSTSPYLRQHAHQLIDWWPWCDEAFEKARDEEKLVFLSIGYSSCHWCHVMSHESFDDPDVAELLNKDFISIKVDREEHPNVDAGYMAFVQATLGQGGWPMSLWLTPEGLPVVGGAYFPKDDRDGRSGFHRICREIQELWENEHVKLNGAGKSAIDQLQKQASLISQNPLFEKHVVIDTFFGMVSDSFDLVYGGFGGAPKFPQASYLSALLTVAENSEQNRRDQMETMLKHTLTMISRGGIFDHVGGGFHRYSVDQYWHIPHFEKMLYDQAQLIELYARAYERFEKSDYGYVVEKTVGYVLQYLKDPNGGFHSAEDADSYDEIAQEKQEGAYWTWQLSEIEELLGDQAAQFCEDYGVKKNGNAPQGSDPHGELWGRNTLIFKNRNQALSRWEKELCLLKESREKRPHPFRDTKCITAWNAMLAKSLLIAGKVFGNTRWISEGENILSWIYENLWDGKALSRGMTGNTKMGPGYAVDYAHVLLASLESESIEIKEKMLKLQASLDFFYWSQEMGGFVTKLEVNGRALLTMKEDYDGAEPSAQSIMAHYYLKIGDMEKLHTILKSANDTLTSQPTAVTGLVTLVSQL